MYLLRVLIGSLGNLCLLWLAGVITLVLVLRHSFENRSIKELKKLVLGITRNTDYTLPFRKGMLLRVGRYQYQVFDTISTGKKAKIAISGCLNIVRSCLPLGRKVLLLRVGGYPYKVRDIITGEMPTISILASGIGCFDIV